MCVEPYLRPWLQWQFLTVNKDSNGFQMEQQVTAVFGLAGFAHTLLCQVIADAVKLHLLG